MEAYLALLSMRKEQEKEAECFLDDAVQKLSKMNNPREAGYVYMAIADQASVSPTFHQYPLPGKYVQLCDQSAAGP